MEFSIRTETLSETGGISTPGKGYESVLGNTAKHIQRLSSSIDARDIQYVTAETFRAIQQSLGEKKKGKTKLLVVEGSPKEEMLIKEGFDPDKKIRGYYFELQTAGSDKHIIAATYKRKGEIRIFLSPVIMANPERWKTLVLLLDKKIEKLSKKKNTKKGK